MLSATDTAELTKIGIDVSALTAVITDPAEKPLGFTFKPETVKSLFPTHSFLNEDELNGLKGRTKQEVLTQATELGIKAIKEAAGVTFEGKDPAKFIEALTNHLKIPVDSKLLEKEKDITTLKETLEQEKLRAKGLEDKFADIEAVGNFSKLLPDNFMKAIPPKIYRATLAEEGIEIKDYEGKQAVYVNGEVQKDKELNLIDPKTFLAEHAKNKGLITADTTQTPPPKKTFDTKGGGTPSKFDHDTAYQAALAAGGGKWNEKAQAEYTNLQIEASK